MNYYFFGKSFTHGQLHEAINAFLAVAGLVYGLMIAQLYATTQHRCAAIRAVLATEISSIHMAALNLRAMPDRDREKRTDMLQLLLCYVKSTLQAIDQGVSASAGMHEDLEGLYAVSSLLSSMEAATVQQNNILDKIEAIAEARYTRCFHETGEFSVYVWLFILSLASMMFWGVSLIQSGSDRLDLCFCLVTVLSIMYSLKMLADADNPSVGETQACKGVLLALERSLTASMAPGREMEQLKAPPKWRKAVHKVQACNMLSSKGRTAGQVSSATSSGDDDHAVTMGVTVDDVTDAL